MKKSTVLWMIFAAALILAGGILFGGVMTMLQWDFNNLSTEKYETNSYEITESFTNISVITNTANVVFTPSEDGKIRVVCYESEQEKHAVSVKEGTLTIALQSSKKWYHYIGIHVLGYPSITVSLPLDAYSALSVRGKTGAVKLAGAYSFESVNISLSTGDIKVESISTGSMALSVTTGSTRVSQVSCAGDASFAASTGKTELQELQCKNLISTGSTGKLIMTHVVAAERMELKRSTGNITLHQCDAGEISAKTSTGHVTASLLSPKEFQVRTDTGRVEVPQSGTGGRCQIHTDTGNIEITIV